MVPLRDGLLLLPADAQLLVDLVDLLLEAFVAVAAPGGRGGHARELGDLGLLAAQHGDLGQEPLLLRERQPLAPHLALEGRDALVDLVLCGEAERAPKLAELLHCVLLLALLPGHAFHQVILSLLELLDGQLLAVEVRPQLELPLEELLRLRVREGPRGRRRCRERPLQLAHLGVGLLDRRRELAGVGPRRLHRVLGPTPLRLLRALGPAPASVPHLAPPHGP
mmetsp:Transcript_109731/g.310428  ORF Transcript_109731/g.310428 Transcript_109731/m.310428 type:complete len:223 (+) Transcript_109731:961-1629(+)